MFIVLVAALWTIPFQGQYPRHGLPSQQERCTTGIPMNEHHGMKTGFFVLGTHLILVPFCRIPRAMHPVFQLRPHLPSALGHLPARGGCCEIIYWEPLLKPSDFVKWIVGGASLQMSFVRFRACEMGSWTFAAKYRRKYERQIKDLKQVGRPMCATSIC